MCARIELLGLEVDPLRMDQAVGQVMAWVADPVRSCHYVVTPNVDHVVLLEHHTPLREAYSKAGMILVDGMPVYWAAKLLGRPLPARVPGSDLVPALFNAARSDAPLRVFLLGAGPGVAQRAASKIEHRWPNVQVVGTYCPPLGFERDEAENQRILEKVSAAHADVLVVGLGAPKQELWVHKFHEQIDCPVALCVGATIDFLAGEKKRAPVWMRQVGLEWLHRACTEPKRLAKRYLKDAWIFPQLVAKAWWRSRRQVAVAGGIK
ncbi:glycosyl transferase, WecB/TagA/CpsF family [Pirellula staleyi DSM 6068]|uniref:Glycosyl transferase, WecB/TagA/CpsF family n=1 Tax=Pirellula staleyi (strain ATCC 27377 / DSM 6068 / ICPB 4128) TaxID=530564 RepID=D2R4M0_PIRSD|nr:WecB/TagA/CpsF family glycosyltransferase [Pirellula staleyi]ADB17086.1 glycosyl transferase, WecB/TagA/CpsF family [Pirellula staleyi DSM 6068]